jgi:hypothetical protein
MLKLILVVVTATVVLTIGGMGNRIILLEEKLRVSDSIVHLLKEKPNIIRKVAR